MSALRSNLKIFTSQLNLEITIWQFLMFLLVCTREYTCSHLIAEQNCNKIITLQEGLNGTVKTIDYPNPYPDRSYCEIQFLGNATHRVLIRFNDFYLHHPLGTSHDPKSCDGLDKLQIYDGVREAGVLLGEFCGSNMPKSVMSSDSDLTLNLTTYTHGSDARGFDLEYSFLSNYGITEGEQVPKTNCSFRYISYNSDSSKTGNITSPNPGGIYPRNTNCTYLFKGHSQERIFLKFEYFDLEGIEPCTTRSGSDYLEFSSHPGMDPCAARRCGRFAPGEVVSEGPYFRVKFVSNHKLDGLGFKAEYHFVEEDHLPQWVTPHHNQTDVLRGDALVLYVVFFLNLLLNRSSFTALF